MPKISKTYPPVQLTVNMSTYKTFGQLCNLLAKGYVVTDVKFRKDPDLIEIRMDKDKELEDVSID